MSADQWTFVCKRGELMNKEKQKCQGECGKLLDIDKNFYKTRSKMFPSGRSSICKKCIKEMIDYENMKSIYDVLRQLDISFIYEYWNKAVESKKETFGIYVTMANSLPQFEGLTWEDSVFEEDQKNTLHIVDNVTKSSKKTDFAVTEEIIDKWGVGYKPEQYKLFERKYSRLIRNYGEKTELHTEGLLTYIRFRVQEEISTASGNIKEAKEWAALATKAAQDAKINVSQLSKSDISGGVDVLSQLFEAVENEVSVIPLLPKILEQPYDDADLIIWANVNYNRRLEDRPKVPYRDVWNFYDEMLHEYFESQGYGEKEIEEFKAKRNNVFRDLEKVYVEPLYESDGE
jgi:hypothetical protein